MSYGTRSLQRSTHLATSAQEAQAPCNWTHLVAACDLLDAERGEVVAVARLLGLLAPLAHVRERLLQDQHAAQQRR